MAAPTRNQQIQDLVNAAVQAAQTVMQQQIDAIATQANSDRRQAQRKRVGSLVTTRLKLTRESDEEDFG